MNYVKVCIFYFMIYNKIGFKKKDILLRDINSLQY
jgi:hypothetical protein